MADTLFDILAGIILMILGCLMFIYRNRIGDFTDYYTGKGGYVDKPTPGWMLIPFALGLIGIGIVVIYRSI